jgi:hypothetical protein
MLSYFCFFVDDKTNEHFRAMILYQENMGALLTPGHMPTQDINKTSKGILERKHSKWNKKLYKTDCNECFRTEDISAIDCLIWHK